MLSIFQKMRKKVLPDTDYSDVAQEIVNYADMIEAGTLTIEGFTNRWNARSYKSNLFSSSMEISMMSNSISDLIDLHYSCVGHSDAYFAKRLREIVYQNATQPY